LTACGQVGRPLGALAPIGSLDAAARRADVGYKVSGSVSAKKWEKIERLTSTEESFPTERSRPGGRQSDPEIVAAFGTDKPPSRDVLLHYAKGWESGKGTPVLLVHGAILEATQNWIEPHDKPGLAQALAARGKRVFAVTFAHRHGDNLLQAEQLNNALARVRAVTGAKEVDVVAHSKGTVAARALASGVKLSWMRGYAGDIRRMVLVAGPHLGIDYPFRHPAVNYGLYPESQDSKRNAPMSWRRMLVMGIWVDTSAQTMDGGCFPGQAQLLARWDNKYPLPKLEQDWYTTYHGGQGFASVSDGIDKAIESGGNFIEKLRKHPLDRGVELAVLAGNKQDLKTVLVEKTGPSDSVVFVDSATYTDDMVRGGAKLVAKDVLPFNHMDLVIAPKAQAWIGDQLD
jgi:pimeloyl-ACP methyl ester carboxylesterase